MIKRVAIKKEPKLHAHRYICLIGHYCRKDKCWSSEFAYCMNLQEVNQIKKTLPPGFYLEVHQASHNFVGAWHHCEEKGGPMKKASGKKVADKKGGKSAGKKKASC